MTKKPHKIYQTKDGESLLVEEHETRSDAERRLNTLREHAMREYWIRSPELEQDHNEEHNEEHNNEK